MPTPQAHPPPSGRNSYELHLKHQQNIDHQQPRHFENKRKYLATYGTYTGTYKLTGKAFTARVAHVWKLKDGKIMSFEQFVDSKMVNDAMN